jgi:hypothetical protein
MEKTCLCCTRRLVAHPAVANQRYCSDPECQKARKRNWQKEKLARDPDYRANQAEAQREWCSRNRGYWREYRSRNPSYTETNRVRQRERNRHRRAGAGIAKMDELKEKPAIRSGRYRLIPLGDPGIAKMDALIVEIGVIPEGCRLPEVEGS